MGINIHFIENPEVKNVNVRKEGNGDEMPLAVDIKLHGVAHHQNYHIPTALLGCSSAQAQHFWGKDERQEAVFIGLEDLHTETVFEEGQHCRLNNKDFKGVRIKKFKIKPISGGNLRLTFTVQISNVDRDTIGELAELIKMQPPCEIYADPDLFDEEAA